MAAVKAGEKKNKTNKGFELNIHYMACKHWETFPSFGRHLSSVIHFHTVFGERARTWWWTQNTSPAAAKIPEREMNVFPEKYNKFIVHGFGGSALFWPELMKTPGILKCCPEINADFLEPWQLSVWRNHYWFPDQHLTGVTWWKTI